MKKQIVALSCALALGAGVAWGPASGPSVDATGQAGYFVARVLSAPEPLEVVGVSVGSAIGAHVGYRKGRAWGRTMTVVRGHSARIAVVRATVAGARAGATLGAFGGIVGLVIGAAAGAA